VVVDKEGMHLSTRVRVLGEKGWCEVIQCASNGISPIRTKEGRLEIL
jgi:hypothetical protein